MGKIQTAMIFANTDEDIVSTYVIFEHDDRMSERAVEEAAREAVQEYLNTDEGKEQADSLGVFNWGDAMAHVPEKHFTRHGLSSLPAAARIITLDHDENLRP